MVLGSCSYQSTGHGIHSREPECIPKDHRARLHRYRTFDVERRRGTVCGSAELLSSIAGPYPCVLSLVV